MRDIVVLLFLIACIGAALRKPWWGVLALAIFSYLNPHAYAWGFVRDLPAYQILFLVVAFATFTTKDRQSLPKDWRIPTFFILWAFFFVTTSFAYLQDLAWAKLWTVSKTFLPFIFTLILINTREKLFYLIATIAASIGIVGLKGGIFAVASGFSYRVYGPPQTQFEENNAFAVAVLITIPLVILVYREINNGWIKKICLGSIPFLFASALSSWSRGALLAMSALTLLLIWNSKRKFLAIPLVVVGGFVAVQQLPEEWFGRMQTIETYEMDQSASSRLQAWRDGWRHTLNRPFVGSGFDGWHWVTQRDWHSSYVEMFSEHGFFAFALWISLIIGTLISLTSLARKTKGIEGMEWVTNYSFMLRASLVAYMTGTAFLGLSYWDLLYHLIFISVLVKQFAEQELRERGLEPTNPTFTRQVPNRRPH